MISFTIDCKPIGVNKSYHRGSGPTVEAVAFKNAIEAYATQARMRHGSLEGNLEARIRPYFASGRFDLDGPLKPLLDGMQTAKLISNDRQFKRLLLEHDLDPLHPRVDVALGPLGMNPYERIALLEHQVRQLEAKLEAA